MKKFFLFATAVVAAMTINAKTVDLTQVGTTIDEWTISEATLNETESAEGKYVYDIKAEVLSTSYVNAASDVKFQIKNGSDKKKAFVIYPGKCYEFGGKNGILVLENTTAGEKIRLTVAAKGSSNADFSDPQSVYPKNAFAVSEDLILPAKQQGAEGADEQGYIWKELVYESLGGTVEIKEFNGGYRISKIVVGAAQGVENVFDNAKAVKVFENGQLVIIKNGVRYNALGAQL